MIGLFNDGERLCGIVLFNHPGKPHRPQWVESREATLHEVNVTESYVLEIYFHGLDLILSLMSEI